MSVEAAKDPKDMTKEELLALHEEDAKTIKALEEKLASLRPVSVEEASQEPATEIEKILEDEALVKAFNEVVGNFNLKVLYDTNVNQKDGEEFHKCCDRKGPVVMLMFTEDSVFGVCCKSDWFTRKSPVYIFDHRSYFFVLRNPAYKNVPDKFPVKQEHAKYAYLSAKSYFPLFGEAGTDLTIGKVEDELSVTSKPKTFAMKENALFPKSTEAELLERLVVLAVGKKIKPKKE